MFIVREMELLRKNISRLKEDEEATKALLGERRKHFSLMFHAMDLAQDHVSNSGITTRLQLEEEEEEEEEEEDDGGNRRMEVSTDA